METTHVLGRVAVAHVAGPHSLGKSIEWKLEDADRRLQRERSSPHSLGKSIEWKLFLCHLVRGRDIKSPLAGEIN